jgi:hypothetical protein
MVDEVMSRLNLTSTDAETRVSARINKRYKQVTSAIGLITSRRTIADVVCSAADIGVNTINASSLPEVTVENMEKVIRVTTTSDTYDISTISVANPTVVTTAAAHDLESGQVIFITGSETTPTIDGRRIITVTGASTFTVPVNVTVGSSAGTFTLGDGAIRVLRPLMYDELVNRPTGTGLPRAFAVKSMFSGYSVLTLDAYPDDDLFSLKIEGYTVTPILDGTAEPLLPGDFHDILVEGAISDELRKMEKPQLAAIAEAEYEKRLSDLRMFIAKHMYLDVFQGKTNNQPFWLRSWYSNYYG